MLLIRNTQRSMVIIMKNYFFYLSVIAIACVGCVNQALMNISPNTEELIDEDTALSAVLMING